VACHHCALPTAFLPEPERGDHATWQCSNLVDLAAWLPFWISREFSPPELNGQKASGTSFLRAVRLFRIFKIFKSGQYSVGIKVFAGALRLSLSPMVILAVSGGVSVVILSSVIWMVERPSSAFITEDLLQVTGMARPEPGKVGLQDLCFGTIPSAAWWVLATMTTVGYGDCSPITGLGKVIGVLCMTSGIIVLGLPITVLGSNFARMTDMYEEDTARFNENDYDSDNMISEVELRDFLYNRRREGVLRRDVDTTIPTLLARYDPDNRGYLDVDTFSRLRRDVCTEADPLDELRDVMERRFELLEAKIELVLSEVCRDKPARERDRGNVEASADPCDADSAADDAMEA
jgi:hypothetical protein